MSTALELRARKAPQDGPGGILRDLPLMAAPISAEHRLLSYLELLWEHRRFILRVGLWALLTSTLLAFVLPARYEAATRLMPPDMQQGPGLSLLAGMSARSGAASGGLSGLSGLAGEVLGVKSSGALFVGLLSSETIQDRLIEKFQLQALYRDSKVEDARVDLTDHTSVSEDRKSGIILITVRDHDPRRAAAMADEYVTELDRLVAHLSTSSARRERIFLEGRLKEVKADLDTAAKTFSDFASQNTAIDIPAQERAMVEAAATLQGQMIASEAQLSALQQIYADSNVRVLAARARVNELQKKLEEIGGVGTQAQVTNNKSMYPSIRKLPLLGVTYADLYQRTKIQQTVYELLTQQYELAKVQEAKEIPSVKVLDAAMVPTKRSFPPRTLIALIGAILGVLGAAAWIAGKARWQMVTADDPRKVFAIKIFTTIAAAIPKLSQNGTGVSANGRRPWVRDKAQDTDAVKHTDS